jgi:hypothetical protein
MACKHEGGTDPCIRTKDGHCLIQRKAYDLAMYRANREERIAITKKWRDANPGYSRALYEANREKRLAQSKANYEANREKRIAQCKARYEANREKYLAESRAREIANRCEHGRRPRSCGICQPQKVIVAFKAGAHTRNLPWELTDEQAVWLMQQPCAYCGQEVSGGIDRAKNEYGYTVLNSVPCCSTCNMSKRVLTVKAFLVAVNQIARYCPDYPKFKRRWERIRKKLTQLGEQQDADVSVSLYRMPRNHGAPNDLRGIPETPVVHMRGAVGSDSGMSSVV